MIFGCVINKAIAVALMCDSAIGVLKNDTGTKNVLGFKEEGANSHPRDGTSFTTLANAVDAADGVAGIGCRGGTETSFEKVNDVLESLFL